MSGDGFVLAAHAASFAPRGVRDAVHDAVLHILSYQFVSSGGKYFLATKGSGMGFFFSGEIADAAFIREMEEPRVLTAVWRRRYGIKQCGGAEMTSS